ncbi:hypothetical protein FKD06_25390 [Serratia sp. SRS-8-S-2018]|nr:hypothetical protein FKD06_25390 [Serratia sp. SRS-8-S-2018]
MKTVSIYERVSLNIGTDIIRTMSNFICSYCEPGGLDCESVWLIASPLSLNVSRGCFSFAVNVSRNMR